MARRIMGDEDKEQAVDDVRWAIASAPRVLGEPGEGCHWTNDDYDRVEKLLLEQLRHNRAHKANLQAMEMAFLKSGAEMPTIDEHSHRIPHFDDDFGPTTGDLQSESAAKLREDLLGKDEERKDIREEPEFRLYRLLRVWPEWSHYLPLDEELFALVKDPETSILTVEVTKRVRSDIPGTGLQANAGEVYAATMNPRGAVSAVLEGYKLLGLRPGEFEFVYPTGTEGD
jgi:hypothetical protein